MESFFLETKYSGYPQGIFKPDMCPPSMICTDSAFEDSNVCLLDGGGPLYVLECFLPRPKCLYGITSFSTNGEVNQNNDTWCDGKSIFVNVLAYRYAIMRLINNAK